MKRNNRFLIGSGLGFFERVIDECSEAIEKLPIGRVRIRSMKHADSYYVYESKDDTAGKYYDHAQLDFVKQIMQRNYYLDVIEEINKYLEKRLEENSTKNMAYVKDAKFGIPDISLQEARRVVDAVYERLPENKKHLIESIKEKDKKFEAEWLKKMSIRNSFMEEQLQYSTEGGIKVRSKSELMIATVLENMKLPFVYEIPLMLDNHVLLSPDFAILDPATHRIIYWEHFGLIDDVSYRSDTAIKFRQYAENGIFPGVNLIFTMESSKAPFDLNLIIKIVKTYFNIDGAEVG